MNRYQFCLSSISSGAVLAAVRTGSFATTVASAGASTAQRLVASFDRDFNGPHPGFRANHAKGILSEGTFAPSAEASRISVAPHFKDPVKVTLRFSNFGGLPLVPDTSPGATPHGLAVKFHLPGGEETDIVGHSVPFFPSATPEAFDEFLGALRGGAATLAPFAATRPAVAQFIGGLKPPPVSFATIRFSLSTRSRSSIPLVSGVTCATA